MPEKQKTEHEPGWDWRETSLSSCLGSLGRQEDHERHLITTGAGPEQLAGAAKGLASVLLDISKLRNHPPPAVAAWALLAVERFKTHPGRYVEPATTIYWDWTMDASCAEEVPAKEMTVADAAAQAAGNIRRFLPAAPSAGEG